MNKTMNNEQDKLLREALRRRADRVPTLSDDFQDAVLHRIQRTLPVPPLKGGDGLRRGSLKIWAWVGSVAAMLVIGLFLFFGRNGTNGMDGTNETPANHVTVVPEGQGDETPPSPALQPNAEPLVAETSQSSPSLQGRAGGGSSRGQASGVSSSAPTLADLYAAIDQMTDEAIEEADRLMAEALVREYTDDEPS